MKKVRFISFEGPDGSGKTTLIKGLVGKLESHYKMSKKFKVTREPGGSIVGEKIRQILSTNKMNERTEALLFAASRADHYYEAILDSFNKNEIILCDRFLESSLVYQGYFKNIGIYNILKINQFGIGEFRPDLIFYMDIDPNNIPKRLSNRGDNNHFDSIDIQQILKIQEGYKILFSQLPKDIILITLDGNQSEDKILNDAFNKIIKYLD